LFGAFWLFDSQLVIVASSGNSQRGTGLLTGKCLTIHSGLQGFNFCKQMFLFGFSQLEACTVAI